MSCCARYQEQRMKRIPAKYLTEKVKHKLSVLLDPVKGLPGADYKTFAELNGLTPDIQMWLDSQRTHPTMTSNIKLTLEYLIQQRGDRYTVYNVYDTLCQMNSDGVYVILEGMSDICMLYNGGTREGQEHSEPSSVASPPMSFPSLPSVPGTQRSEHFVSDGSFHQNLNNLGDPNPQVHSVVIPSQQFQNILDSRPINNFQLHGHPVPIEDSYGSTLTPTGQRHPEERSVNYNSPLLLSPSSSGDPPSYEESQRNHGNWQLPSPKYMLELKHPLPEPEFDFIPPSESFNRTSLASTVENFRLRPESFPQTRSKHTPHKKRPFSEGSCPDHQGACGCGVNDAPVPVGCCSKMQPDTRTDVSAGIQPWPDHDHQTDVKRPLECVTEKIGDSRIANWIKNVQPQSPIKSNTYKPADNKLKSNYFVFILAGDNNMHSQDLQIYLESLSDALKQDCIPHVIMSSCWKWPIVKLRRHILDHLPPLTIKDPNGDDCFLKESLKKAARVLLLISPGTYCYLDKYAKGGKEHADQLQAKLRQCYETLKDEWFLLQQDIKYQRILPVMLTNMETDRSHLPSFFVESKLYWFPHRPLDCDYTLTRVLKNELKKDTLLKKQLNAVDRRQ